MEGPDGEHHTRTTSQEVHGNPLMRNASARRSQVAIERAIISEDDEGVGFSVPSDHEDENGEGGNDIARKAGIILGIHNIFIVIPQFIVNGLSSLVFAIMEPHRSVLDSPHPAPAHGHVPLPNSTTPLSNSTSSDSMIRALLIRQEDETIDIEDPEDASPNALAFMFRFGGVCALISFVLAWRLAKLLKTRRR